MAGMGAEGAGSELVITWSWIGFGGAVVTLLLVLLITVINGKGSMK